jgi:hypothetical protein
VAVGLARKTKSNAEPSALDPKNGTSTSTGGATATRNSGKQLDAMKAKKK